MQIKELSLGDSVKEMELWKTTYIPKNVEGVYLQIREDLGNCYRRHIEHADGLDDYEKDVTFGAFLYDYFAQYAWFNLRVAENDGFWRYLSIVVVPDIVGLRWGNDNDDHYYKKSVRIWLKTLWWYIHLSWYRSTQESADLLMSNNFTTDTILNLVERSGRLGTYVDVYRLVMYYYHKIPAKILSEYSKKFGKSNLTLFRVVMKLNTAKLLSINPVLYLGGVDGYVKSLFEEAGVPVN